MAEERIYDLIKGQPGADGPAGRCDVVLLEAGDVTEYVGFFEPRTGTWRLYRRGGKKGDPVTVVPARRVKDRREPMRYKDPPIKKTEETEREKRVQWWRLPDPPGQIKL